MSGENSTSGTPTPATKSASASPQAVPLPATVAANAAPPTNPAPEPKPNPLAHFETPFQVVDFSLKGYHLDATVAPERVVRAVYELDASGFALDTITGVDWLAEQQFELVYDFFHPVRALRVVVRTRVPREQAEVQTISEVFPGADWHERETHDFFGIRFAGHPNLTPFLLEEDATYHPLRKDFKP